jgi:hypothetical protein
MEEEVANPAKGRRGCISRRPVGREMLKRPTDFIPTTKNFWEPELSV